MTILEENEFYLTIKLRGKNMAEININNIIQISISAPAIGAKQVNLSTIALFTDEQSESVIDYAVYKSATGIANDFGVDSKIYKQAVAIFSQSPSILTNNGYVVAIPMQPSVVIDATAGYGITNDVNLQNFREVTDGSINITQDGGTTVALTGLNFSACKTTEAIAGVFNNAIAQTATAGTAVTGTITVGNLTSIEDGSFSIAVDGENATEISDLDFTGATDLEDVAYIINEALTGVSCVASEDVLVFTSDTKGADSSVVLSAGVGGTSIYGEFGVVTETAGTDAVGCAVTLYDINQLKFTSTNTGATSSILLSSNTTGTDLTGTAYLGTLAYVQGQASYTGRERLIDAIIRTRAQLYYHCVLPCLTLGDDEIINASDYIQTETMMLAIADNDLACCDDGNLFSRIANKSNHKTRCFAYFSDDIQDARNMASAYMGRGLCVNFEGSGTTLSMQLKALATIEPDPNITETLFQKAKKVGADLYCSIYGVNSAISNGANDFFDNVYNDNWLYVALQVAGFNALRYANTKIPQTNTGIDALVTAYKQVLEQGVRNGAFSAGEWTLTFPFGDPELFAQNIRTFGYYVYPEPLASQSQESRDSREAPFISMAVKRAGAMHTSAVVVYINN